MTALHCWNCGEAIAQADMRCPHCETDLIAPRPADHRFAVVSGGRAVAVAPRPRTMAAIAQLPPRGRFVARYWRGEIALDLSFWIVTLIGCLAIFVIPASIYRGIIGLFPESSSYTWTFRVLFLVALIQSVAGVWQVVGAWRAARRWVRYSPRPAWGIAAQIVLLVVALYVGGAIVFCGFTLTDTRNLL